MRLPAREIFFTAFVESGALVMHLADCSACRRFEFFAPHYLSGAQTRHLSGAQTRPDDEPLDDNDNDDHGQDLNRFHDAAQAEVS